MLTVLVTATDEQLTTRQNVKDVLELTDSVHDEFLDRQIKRVSARLDTVLSRRLALTKYQAILPAYGGVTLLLPAYPVRDVFRVFDGTATGTSNQLTSTGYRLDKDRGLLNRDEGWPWTRQIEDREDSVAEIVVPGGEYQNYLVEFTAGYVLSGGLSTDSALWSTQGGSTATGLSLPFDLEDAAIELVRTNYMRRQRDPGVVSERLGDVSVTYEQGTEAGLPSAIMSQLAPYRSV